VKIKTNKKKDLQRASRGASGGVEDSGGGQPGLLQRPVQRDRANPRNGHGKLRRADQDMEDSQEVTETECLFWLSII